MGSGGGVPAYISNRHPQFSFFVELAGGDDDKVLVEQSSHKTSLFGLVILANPAQSSDRIVGGRVRCQNIECICYWNP